MTTKITFYLYTILFFFIDIFFYGLLQEKLVHSLLCFFSIYIFSACTFAEALFLIFLLTMQGMFDNAYYGSCLIYLFPITCIITVIRPMLQPYSMIPFIAAFTLCMVGHYSLVSYYSSWPVWVIGYYTFYELCGNIIMLTIFLKYFKGRWGNRF